MEPFTKHTGLVALLDRVNVDTDQMVPKQFLTRVTREGFGEVLFYDWRYTDDKTDGDKPNPEFVLNHPRYQGASVLLARANFGCGSSREHAPWAIAQYGFRLLIAPSYADIFYNNCFKNSILPVTLPDAQVDELFKKCEEKEGYQLSADLEKQVVFDDDGFQASFDIDPDRKERLLNGLDDIGISLQLEDKIAAYEKANPEQLTMYDPVDLTVTG